MSPDILLWIRARVAKTGTTFLILFLETTIILTRSYTASQPTFDDNLNGVIDSNDLIINANESQALNNLTVSLSTLELLEEQMYYKFCQFMHATKKIDFCRGFYDEDD